MGDGCVILDNLVETEDGEGKYRSFGEDLVEGLGSVSVRVLVYLSYTVGHAENTGLGKEEMKGSEDKIGGREAQCWPETCPSQYLRVMTPAPEGILSML